MFYWIKWKIKTHDFEIKGQTPFDVCDAEMAAKLKILQNNFKQFQQQQQQLQQQQQQNNVILMS